MCAGLTAGNAGAEAPAYCSPGSYSAGLQPCDSRRYTVGMTPLDPDYYWVQEGQLLAGEYPGHRNEAAARQKLGDLLDVGIRTFVDLTEAGELTSYDDWLKDEASGRGLTVRYSRFPIIDLDVPTVPRMREILTEI